jgi:hypothetical protein
MQRGARDIIMLALRRLVLCGQAIQQIVLPVKRFGGALAALPYARLVVGWGGLWAGGRDFLYLGRTSLDHCAISTQPAGTKPERFG